MYAWKLHRRDKFVIQSVTEGIREYMECLNKFCIEARVMPRPIRNLFRDSIYSRIPPVTDCITNKGQSPSNGKLSDFSFYIDSQKSAHRKFKK